MNGAELITQERQRQIAEERYSTEKDVLYWSDQQLVRAAVCYALPATDRWAHGINATPAYWPWGERFWKPTPHDRIKELTKAGALIAAEIDRLLALPEQKSQERENDARTE